jgi:hypothetical protein
VAVVVVALNVKTTRTKHVDHGGDDDGDASNHLDGPQFVISASVVSIYVGMKLSKCNRTRAVPGPALGKSSKI